MERGLAQCSKMGIWACLIFLSSWELHEGSTIYYTTLYWTMPSTRLGTVGTQ